LEKFLFWGFLPELFWLFSPILPLVVADFGRFETKNDNSASKKSSPKAAKTQRVQFYFSYINIICLITVIYKTS